MIFVIGAIAAAGFAAVAFDRWIARQIADMDWSAEFDDDDADDDQYDRWYTTE